MVIISEAVTGSLNKTECPWEPGLPFIEMCKCTRVKEGLMNIVS